MTIPAIMPVPANISRPLWSVMIPTFNCARFLGQTLDSVLKQDPGAERMEIVVVDDLSTTDDPEEVVHRVGAGRVRFERNPRNLGAVPNFNHCIALSKGELIHILHGDDLVTLGFYDAISRMAAENPACAFFATRTIAVDEDGVPEWISGRIKTLEQASHDVSEVVMSQQFQTPSVVVRRSFYERHGGFETEFVHCADWEMWVRAISEGGGVVNPQPLARYRVFSANDTGRLSLTGGNIRDRVRLIDRFSKFQGFRHAEFLQGCAGLALAQAERFARDGNALAAHANLLLYQELEPWKTRLVRATHARMRWITKFVRVQ